MGADTTVHRSTAQSSWETLKAIPPVKTLALVSGVVGMLIVDYWFVQRHVSHIWQPLIWLTAALVFYTYVRVVYTSTDAAQWASGYLCEWAFQLDNLFVFHLIFRRYLVPGHLVNKGLFACLCGQQVTRFLFYIGMAQVIRGIRGLRLLMGLLLVGFGCATILESRREAEEPAQDTCVMSLVRHCFGARLAKAGEGDQNAFFIKVENRWCATVLVPVVMCLILSDLILGADCAIAKIEQIPAPLWNLSSSAMALFALRASYGLITSMADRFADIQVGIGIILVFVGIELILARVVSFSVFATPVLIVAVMLGVVLVSFVRAFSEPVKQPETGASSSRGLA